jgi:hypothetical protein
MQAHVLRVELGFARDFVSASAAKPPPNRHQLYLELFQMVAVAALTLD